jgi:hypothetical protein
MESLQNLTGTKRRFTIKKEMSSIKMTYLRPPAEGLDGIIKQQRYTASSVAAFESSTKL